METNWGYLPSFTANSRGPGGLALGLIFDAGWAFYRLLPAVGRLDPEIWGPIR